MDVALDDGLNDVMGVVRNILNDPLALVDDLSVMGAPDRLVVVLLKAGEPSLVLGSVGVLLADLRRRVNLLVVELGLVLHVLDGLDVVLDVVHVAVVLTLAGDLLDRMGMLGLLLKEMGVSTSLGRNFKEKVTYW